VNVLRFLFAGGFVMWSCGFCLFIVMPNLMVATAQAQLPFGQTEAAQWQLDQPIDSDEADGPGPLPAGVSPVPRDGYVGRGATAPWGVPLRGPVQHWGVTYPRPLLGCRFRDPRYPTHVGVDLPVDSGTPVYATIGGKVVWAGTNGAWGLLVVVENAEYQIWLAHNESLAVSVGQLVVAGQVVAWSDNSGRSTGPHVHYGIKRFSDPADSAGAWLDPESFFSPEDVIAIGCGG
jgi:murein DD-endopeptidase MepM/ murein hydrolase activator NlpD